ncbi:hypothetical protein LCGC14_1848960 [marine sediment metagenome]|uniref:Uncharacterized protein n=1 Tax=marine sediment metagenome TaxID=412755 RepID=A0A0F9GZ87_9ZZZZ
MTEDKPFQKQAAELYERIYKDHRPALKSRIDVIRDFLELFYESAFNDGVEEPRRPD